MENTAIQERSSMPTLRAERPVFVADHQWRHRAVGAAIALAGALLLAWLAAIVAGALGFGSLPALPFVGKAQEPPAPIVSPAVQKGASLRAPGPRATASPPSRAQPRSGARAEGRAAPLPAGTGNGASSAARQPTSGIPQHAPNFNSAHAGTRAPASTPSGENPSPAGRNNATTGTGTGETQTGTGTGETQTGTLGGSISSSSEAHGAPTITRSGHEVPSGSAGEPSADAAPVATESTTLASQRRPATTSG